MLCINHQKFELLSELFYDACGIRLALYDENYNLIYKAPQLNPICEELWKSPTLYKRCIDSNQRGMRCAAGQNSVYLYECHIGFKEAVTPIRSNNTIIGYLMFGQLIDEYVNLQDLRYVLMKKCESHKLNIDFILEQLTNIKRKSIKEINAIAKLMDMCYEYMLLNDIIKIEDLTLSQILHNYIIDNISEDLRISVICSNLNISRSLLYKTSLSAFGCGISEYIQQCRISKSKDLLKNSNTKISNIAMLVGINDFSYFTKIFKKYTGLTPKKYRNNNQ